MLAVVVLLHVVNNGVTAVLVLLPLLLLLPQLFIYPDISVAVFRAGETYQAYRV